MKDIGLRRRKYSLADSLKPSAQEPSRHRLFISPPKVDLLTPPEEDETTPPAEHSKTLIVPVIWVSHPVINLGVGQLDPFNSFPIQGNSEVDLLIDHINDDTHTSFKLFREYWFPISVQDPGAFQCTLALAARHRMTGFPPKSKGRSYFMKQYVAYYAAAIRSIKDRIGDATQNKSDDIVAAVMLLACDHASSNASTNFMRHMDALETIIQLRGGIETLESNKKLRLLLFWIDTIGSSALNCTPRLPRPDTIPTGL